VAGDFDDFGDETGEWRASARLAEGSVVLLVLAPGGIRSFELPRSGVSSIGRAPTSDLFIDHPSVSRNHAEIAADPEGARVRDLASRNGTRLNGERLTDGAVLLKIGDQIAFGDVTAQLQLVRRLPTARVAQWIKPDAFEQALVIEAERALRFGLSLGFLRVEISPPPERPDELRDLMTRTLRLIDMVTSRAPSRFDLLLPGCDKNAAINLGGRVHEMLRALGKTARIGVAAYPGDAPSAESLPLAAQLALHDTDDGVGAARQAARVLQLGTHEVVVADPEMVRLFALIERAAESPMPVLVHGETGSGKEIVAEALHALGNRAGKPLVRLNCAAVTETLLESELFGHERGAFSGAVAAKPGLIEQADGGTLFLDEIAEMSAMLQAKLLRVLEDHTVRRVGAVKDKRVDIRLVAASHRDLAEQVARGLFRQDLYYRLNSLLLRVPPLRQRRREILLLAERFIAQAAKETRRPQLTLSPPAAAALSAYDWPGNIRELRNIMRRAVMLADSDVVELQHLPAELVPARSAAPEPPSPSAATIAIAAPAADENTQQISLSPSTGIKTAVEQLERGMIASALREHDGNQTRAAAQLGITRQALAQKIAKYGISTKP
jgi:two-component system, NtrC family, response regulator AtoC